MTKQEKIDLLMALVYLEELNDIGNLSTADRREFQYWIDEMVETDERKEDDETIL